MSSILLLYEDGNEALVSGGGIGGGGQIVSLPRGADLGSVGDDLAYVDITNVGDAGDALPLGSHFLTTDDLGKEGEVITKIEVDNVPVSSGLKFCCTA